jgi:hypothetical protein
MLFGCRLSLLTRNATERVRSSDVFPSGGSRVVVVVVGAAGAVVEVSWLTCGAFVHAARLKIAIAATTVFLRILTA